MAPSAPKSSSFMTFSVPSYRSLADDDPVALHTRHLDGRARLDEATVRDDVHAGALDLSDPGRPQRRQGGTGTTELQPIALRRRRVALLSAHLRIEHEAAAER